MLEFDPLDEYPIHQVPLPMRYTATSDRNFYDRCIFQGVDHEADAYFITGLGVYPNLGVIDAYATVRRGDRQWAVRTSGRRPDDKLKQEVGPYRIEVIEPFKKLRLICDADDHGRRLRPALGVRVRADRGTAAHPPPGRPHPARRVTLRGRRHVDRRAALRRRDRRGHPRPLHRAPATARGASGPSARRSRPVSRASSTACGGAGCRCVSTTSRCT